MREMVRYGFILGIICALASASLAAVNNLTKSRIVAQAKAEEENGLKEVMPQAITFEPIKAGNEIIYYKAYAKDAKMIGVAFKASGKGYSSNIDTIVGMVKDGTITAIKILSQNETPRLGTRVTEPSFTGQFHNRDIRNLKEVQAITGATISSKAVIESVRKKAQEIQLLIKDE